jgi:hypothetical protein
MIKRLNLSAEIPPSRELCIKLPSDVPTGPAQIEVVVSSPSQSGAPTLGDLAISEFFGMWQDRGDIEDSSQFARRLRSNGWKRSVE